MSRWRIEFKPSAQRKLAKLPAEVRGAIGSALERFAESGQGDLKKMQGTANDWRLRVGDYRVIFRREADRLVILVVDLGHRRDVYR